MLLFCAIIFPLSISSRQMPDLIACRPIVPEINFKTQKRRACKLSVNRICMKRLRTKFLIPTLGLDLKSWCFVFLFGRKMAWFYSFSQELFWFATPLINLHLSVEQHAQIKMALSALQKADKAMDDHLLPASQMWKNSCRIMYQMILLSNCYQNREKTPQTLDISRRLGQCYLFPLALFKHNLNRFD